MLTRSYRLPYPVKRSSLHFMQELCRSMAHYSDIKFFWKDKSRCFLGVSRAFLDYYGIEREADLIGKTDEDMGWHIDYHPYKEIEEAVLTKGAVVRNAPGQCIIGGRPRHIVATKFPIYRGRHIIGLVGYFDDSERISAQKEQLQKLNVIDGETSLLNFRGLLLAGEGLPLTLATDLNQYIGRDLSENHVIFREVMANDVIAIGMREKDPEQGLQKMLAHIGHSLQAERVLIFEEKGSTVSATYEWHKEGLEPAAVHCQHIPLDTLRPLYAAFDAQQMAIIEDAPAFARAHHFQPYLPNVHRLVVGHLVQSGKSLGFTEVINPSALAFKSAGLLLSTLTLFLAAMLRNRDTFRSLALMSTTDQLTGAGNRRGFTEYVKGLPAGTSAAFIYGDLNGLKKVNDDRGHEEGDKLLCKAVEIMNSAVGKRHVFRMGGDEFLVVMPDVNEKQTKRLLQDLRTRYRSSGVSIALGYIVRQAPIENLDEVLSEADYNMYCDKQRIYGTSRRDRRR